MLHSPLENRTPDYLTFVRCQLKFYSGFIQDIKSEGRIVAQEP
jgi:hypothetical protein